MLRVPSSYDDEAGGPGEVLMAVLCQLRDPTNYRPCDWDLVTDAEGREYWIDEFLHHAESMFGFASTRNDPPPRERIAAMHAAYRDALEHLRRRPDARSRLDVLELCVLRDEFLQKFDIGDPYADVRQRENRAALKLYATVVRRIDDTPADRRVETILRGVFAGNRFDLGSPATTAEYRSGGTDFFGELNRLKARPWFEDDLDVVEARLADNGTPYCKAMVFADNAGADVVLGILPLARHLAGIGVNVVVAATDHYALNDITLDELNGAIEAAARLDEALRRHVSDGRITTVGTGYTHPLIDLSDISDACNEAAADCDLIVLEGMGRAVESNYRTPLRCDCLRIAMIKNEAVARHYGCRLFDLICRWTPGIQGTSG
ncbi:MAG: DUF89 family protein [Phycisphaerales bacterium]|nr:MAG: DUF89 family protein [Phycisphaerales bacterium]